LAPKEIRGFMNIFKNGMADVCNVDLILWKPKYTDILDRLSKLIHGAYSISKGIVVGGYSQGGTLAADIATRYQTRGLGSIVLVAATVFDNSPSVTFSPGQKNFAGTRIRSILGKHDNWCPPEASTRQIDKVVRNFNLTKVGDWPEVLDASHLIFDEGDSSRKRIFDVIREEMNYVDAKRGYKYNEKCCKGTDPNKFPQSAPWH